MGSKTIIVDIATKVGVREGTVCKICQRIALSVEEILFPLVVGWPGIDAKRIISQNFARKDSCFKGKDILDIGIVGLIDGTHFPFLNAPRYDHQSYYSRKKRYALHMQGVCDDRGVFYSFVVGGVG